MNDEEIRVVELGEEARNFLESHLGREIMDRAQKRYEDALLLLAKADPNDPKAIMKIQNQIQLFEQFDAWLREIVDTGNSALEAYKQEQEQT
jgi:hypothetical protein